MFSEKDVSSYSLLARFYILFVLVEVGILCVYVYVCVYIYMLLIIVSKNEILSLFYETLNTSDTKKLELKRTVFPFLPQYETLFAL